MRRFGSVARVKPDKVDEYVRLHAAVWPGVLEQIKSSHIESYSIFLKKLPDGQHYLFSYFEYTGEDFEEDLRRMAADPETQRWWDVCKPCLEPVDELPPGEVWAPMEQVFFQE